jgi:PAS domain S-box-containing protein
MAIDKDNINRRGPWAILAVSIILVIIILSLGLLSYEATEEATFNEFNERQHVLAMWVVNGIELYFKTISVEIRAIGKIPEISRLEEVRTREELNHAFEELNHLGINDIGVLDAEGVLRYSVNAPQLEGVDFSWREYYKEAKGKTSPDTYIIEFIEFKGVKEGEKGVLVTVPMFDSTTGEFAGVVLGTIELNTLVEEYVAPVKPSENGHALLVDDEYNVLYSPDPSHFGKNLFEVTQGFPEFQRVAEDLVDSSSGKVEYSYYTFDESSAKYTEEVEEKLMAYEQVQLGEETWTLAVWTPKRDAQNLIRTAYNRQMIVILFAILVIIFGSAYSISTSRGVRKILEEKIKDKTRELLESEQKYRTLIESSSDCICLIDPEGIIKYMNSAGIKLNEYKSAEEPVGSDATESIHTKYLESMKAAFGKALKGENANLEYISTNSKGKKIWWESTLGPIKDEAGNVTNIVRISRDVSERKRAEETLRKNIEELEKWQKMTVGREKKMIELKREIKELKKKLGKDKPK